MFMLRLLNRLCLMCIYFTIANTGVYAQQDSTETEDYSMFGDATEVKRYATQKVLNLTPTRLISIGMEFQSNSVLPVTTTGTNMINIYNLRPVIMPRLAANFPIISNDKIIVNLGGQYWGTPYSVQRRGVNLVEPGEGLPAPVGSLDANMLHSAGIIASVFKPLNEKNFLILQAGADMNAAFPAGKSVSGKAITISASAIYGWKLSERNMWGLGASRTYRMGRVIHVPVLYWNKTFNDKWGIEMVLPARGFIRHNISAQNLLLLGFELEGNQYLLPQANQTAWGRQDLFLQRGEIKPRLQWDRQLKNFIWLSLQAGARINGRFNFTDRFNGKDDHVVYQTSMRTALFVNFSLNLVSP
jgi:hypothetical protein